MRMQGLSKASSFCGEGELYGRNKIGKEIRAGKAGG